MSREYDIAIVGMACRFPGSESPDEFWQNLSTGVESITRLSDQEIIEAGVPPAWLARPDYVKAAPVLDDPGLFDAAFFGFSPMEATNMDPQHRILLELTHAALEDAACNPEHYSGRIGVFAGAAMNTYFMNSGLNARFAENYIPTLILNDKDFLSTRISYKLGLRGPSLTVQTACSTSLVAVHLARQSLLNGETDMAVAGAVSVRVPNRVGYFYDGSGVVSPDGHVRAFDVGANGTVFGSGAGVVVLKRLADALADGDHIHALIKGSAVNNDGSAKAGYTAPSVDGQADAVVEALANAEVDANSISYLETHGSGTPIGDPIEILALTKAFRNFTKRNGYCAIGSVKTNVGHLDAAAGMAGLIKTVLALKHWKLPPSLHFSQPNPEIDFANSPFYVNTRLTEWKSEGPRRAGVMATGMGGTNAHIILESAPEPSASTEPAPPHLLVLSAKTATALDQATRHLQQFLKGNQSVNMADVAYTLKRGRRVFAHRRHLVCAGLEDAVAVLGQENSKRVFTSQAEEAACHSVVFLLPGVGDHYVGMAQGLYQYFDVFRQELDRCAQIMQPILGCDIRHLIYPQDGVQDQAAKPCGIDLRKMLGRASDSSASMAKLDQTIHAQPALFAVEYALARLWAHWGVQPDKIVGHSMGEYVAACLAGVFSLEDALRLIVIRAKLVNDLPLGAMLAVMLSEKELLPLLDQELSIALINGPKLCVVAGPVAAMTDFENRLRQQGIIFRPVRNAHAFHSRMLDPIVAAFAKETKRVRLNPPRLPFISNVTGTWIQDQQAVDPLYWVEHARCTARFSDALHVAWNQPGCLLLEVGPGRTLGVLALQHPDRPSSANPVVVSSLRHHYENRPDPEFILNSVGLLWQSGIEIDWEKLDQRPDRRRISLPTYPFEKQRYWIESEVNRSSDVVVQNTSEQRADLADWFYTPSWERTNFPVDTTPKSGWKGSHWLIIADQCEFANRLRALLEPQGARVAFACFGDSYTRRNDGVYEIRPAALDDYVQLLGSLKKGLAKTLNIVHLGCLSDRLKGRGSTCHGLNQELGFHSLLNLAKAIGEQEVSIPIRLGVVTSQIHEVTGEETLQPATATVLGPCGVIPKEYPNVTSLAVDLPALSSADYQIEEWGRRLLDEFRDLENGAVIAYRGKYRWKRGYQPLKLSAITAETERECLRAQGLRHRGVYVITGGTGGIGLAVAKYLAKTCQARLVLTKKSAFPQKSEWPQRLASRSLSDSDARIIRQLLEIEPLGGEVDVFVCETSDEAAMRSMITATLSKHQAIHGVIHAAGIVRAGLIQVKTKDTADSVLAPKVSGTIVLYDLLKELDLDFLVLFSSIASLSRPFAEADYSAANGFLDAFSDFSNKQARIRTLAINWPVWREVGMLAELQAQAGMEGWKVEALKKAILTKDGLEAFRRALGSNLPQVIVSPEDLDHLLAAKQGPVLFPAEQRSPERGSLVKRREGVTDEPRNEVEQAVAGIWTSVLGIAPIGIHENFFELGGHSLSAMQIVARIRNAYQVSFALGNFFKGPTIAEMSAAIQSKIVSEIENLTDDEVSQLTSDE